MGTRPARHTGLPNWVLLLTHFVKLNTFSCTQLGVSKNAGTDMVTVSYIHLLLHVTAQLRRKEGTDIYTTIGGLSSKFDVFLAKRSQFDSDHDHIWQACADRSGNGSYLNKLAP